MFALAAVFGALVLKAERPRLFIEAADLPHLRDAWTAPSRARASAEIFRYCLNRIEDSPGEWSGSAWPLEPARSLSLVALMEGIRALDESPGGQMAAKAVSLALSLSSADPGRPGEMLAMAVVYDWLYDLIELEDRARLRAALARHIKFHLDRAEPSFAARASLLACADELPRGRELLARSGGGSIERALFDGLHPAEALPLASALAAPGVMARYEPPHPTPAERALILFAASEGSEEARWAVGLLGEPEEPWVRAFEFLWPSEGGGFPPVPCASSPLPPRAVARGSWDGEAFVASAGPEGGGVYRGRAGVEFSRGKACSVLAGCAGEFSYLRAEHPGRTFEAVVVRGRGAVARVKTIISESALLFRARGEMPSLLLRPEGALRRLRGGLEATPARRADEFVIGFPGAKGIRLRREEELYRTGEAAVAFARGTSFVALTVPEGLERLLICGLKEGAYLLRLLGPELGERTRTLTASPAGLLAVDLPGEEARLVLRREGR